MSLLSKEKSWEEKRALNLAGGQKTLLPTEKGESSMLDWVAKQPSPLSQQGAFRNDFPGKKPKKKRQPNKSCKGFSAASIEGSLPSSKPRFAMLALSFRLREEEEDLWKSPGRQKHSSEFLFERGDQLQGGLFGGCNGPDGAEEGYFFAFFLFVQPDIRFTSKEMIFAGKVSKFLRLGGYAE